MKLKLLSSSGKQSPQYNHLCLVIEEMGFQNLIFGPSMLWNICESFNVIFFFLLLGHCHPFHCNHILHLRYQVLLAAYVEFLKWHKCHCSQSQLMFFSNSICVWFKFTSTLLFLFLPCTFLWSNSLLIIYFYKMSHGFITGRQESMWLHASLSVHELKSSRTVTNYQ